MKRPRKRCHFKLTSGQVLLIRKSYDNGEMTQAELAEKYGIDQKQVSNIVRRLQWRDVPEQNPYFLPP